MTEWTHLRIPLPYRMTLAPPILGVDRPTPGSSITAGSDPDTLTSTDTSRHQTLAGSNTPTGTLKSQGATEAIPLLHDPSGIHEPQWEVKGECGAECCVYNITMPDERVLARKVVYVRTEFTQV